MKSWKAAGSTLAVGLLITACGADNGPATSKVTNGNNSTPRVDNTQPAAASRFMTLDRELTETIQRRERSFTENGNCFELLGESSVNVWSGACGATDDKSGGKQGQKVGGRNLLFTLAVEKINLDAGGKGKTTPPTPPKQGQVGSAPRLYYLVMKGQQQNKGGGKQQQTIADTRVGAFLIEQVEAPEVPVGGGKQNPPVQGKPGQKQEIPPVSGKPGQKQEVAVGKRAMQTREQATLIELCTNDFAKDCELRFEQSHISGIQLLRDDAMVGGGQHQQKGQKPEQKPGQKPEPVVGKAPEQKQGQKPGQKPEVKPEQKPGQKPEPVVGKAPEQKQGQKPTPPKQG